ncbi:MAG: hypothetical protein WAN14_16665 [Candidatus Acidiferrales bacterium]
MDFLRSVTLEELKALSDEEVAKRINANIAPGVGHLQLSLPDFVSAQFYMTELDRRETRRAEADRDRIEKARWKIDFVLESLIVILILVEIGLSIWDHGQYAKNAAAELSAFGEMQGVLSNLQKSSDATAKTLTALQSTTESMNAAIQKELSLFYDVSVGTTYSNEDKRLIVSNVGRTNIVVGGIKISNAPPLMIPNGRVLTPQAMFDGEVAPFYNLIIQQASQDKDGLVPFDVYVKNERLEEFVVHSYFVVSLKDKVTITGIQEGSITPRHWPSQKQ